MKQTLIKIADDHYVVVDDSEIKEGDLCYDPEGDPGHRGIKYVVKCLRTAPDSYWNKHCKKITHSTQKLYKNDFWAIQELKLSEVKELIGKMDVEKKADDIIPNLLHKEYVKIGFIGGYNQALEDNKDKIDKILDFLISKMESISQDMIDKDSLHLGRFRTYKQIYEMIKPKTEWEVTFDEQGKLRLK